MKHSRKFFAWLLVVMMTFAVLAGGCGGSSSSSSGSSDTADDDGSGRNVDGFEDVGFIRLSGQWALFATSLSDREGNVIGSDPDYSPSSRFRIMAYGDGTLLLADYDAGENPTNISFLPITATFTLNSGTVAEVPLVQPGVYKAVKSNLYELKDGDDTYRIEIGDSSTYTNVTFSHIHSDNSGGELSYYEVTDITDPDHLDYEDEDDYTGRNADGWEVIDEFSLLNDTTWDITYTSCRLAESNQTFSLVPQSHTTTRLKLVVHNGVLFWLDSNGTYRYDPLTARFIIDGYNNSVEEPLVRAASGFKKSNSIYQYEAVTPSNLKEYVILESSYPYKQITIMNECYVNGRSAFTSVQLKSVQ